ncbi:MAG: aminomethyl-transferring glycine dehydrogenase subunit GcvPB [Thermodesulfobacteriota bacterium]|nr:aminomethyl-transferring glycine dehydrogenase subunit GcvPB [Thermodesulfobacteriota bacterium]
MKENWPGACGLVLDEPLIFEKGAKGRKGYSLARLDVEEVNPENIWPRKLIRQDLDGFPEMSEVEVVRHFTRLSQWNYGVDSGFYPLGSCTMKYNPKVNEDLARLPGFARAHPYLPEEMSQGALRLMYELEKFLCQISGMDRVTLQPAAGAQGELAGMLMIRACLSDRGNPRKKVLVPDTAHGTNPASSSLCGYQVVQVKSNERGVLSPKTIEEKMDEEVAALMITNPNTLGLFEEHICQIAEVVHRKGGQIYCDGANLNALMGLTRVGDMGVDVLHFNLHKTFSTPHGGGGPGAGPVGVKAHLADYLPVPIINQDGERFYFDYDRSKSIGKIKSFYGNFGILVRAYAYILSMGAEGLKRASLVALLNANYLRVKLKDFYHLPYDFPCLHECVFSDRLQSQYGVTALDIAKRLMDYGFHPPTIYFPLVVHGAMMIEPTESESRETLDQFIAAMAQIAGEARTEPGLLQNAPHKTKVSRLDEVLANRKPRLRWKP